MTPTQTARQRASERRQKNPTPAAGAHGARPEPHAPPATGHRPQATDTPPTVGAHGVRPEPRPRRRQPATGHRQQPPPPVQVRAGLEGMAVRKGNRPPATSPYPAQRRRFDLNLTGLTGVPGLEMRLPAALNPIAALFARRPAPATAVPSGSGYRLPLYPAAQATDSRLARLTAAALTGLMLLALYLLLFSPEFRVQTVEINGLQRLSAHDLNLVLGLQGAQIVTLDPRQLEQNLTRAFPDLAQAHIRLGLPARVIIEAAERQPVIHWRQNTTDYWIDAHGVIFPARLDTVVVSGTAQLITIEAPTLPGLIETPAGFGLDSTGGPQTRPSSALPTAYSQLPTIPPAAVAQITAIQTVIPAGTPLLYDPEQGFGWLDPQGWQVYLGHPAGHCLQDTPRCLNLYQQLLASLLEVGEQPTLISVAYPHRPYYRTEP